MQRRQFLHSSLGFISAAPFLSAAVQREKPWRVALIGAGWYGKNDLLRLIQVADVEVVGICDVDQVQLATAASLVARRLGLSNLPPTFAKYQELLAVGKPELVIIGTPDHWHALPAIAALEAGAHLYLQKPISLDVLEGEAILAAARKHQKKVQIGTQRRSTPHLIDAKKQIVESGRLGTIGHVEMCCYYHMRDKQQRQPIPSPITFDYDTWTGPAPLLPFKGLPHRRWRAFNEYGNGIMGDMCVHMYDTARWMLQLGWPTRISSTGGIYVDTEADANIPDTQTATFEHPDFNCVWQHRTWGNAPDPEYPWALFIYGSEGTLKADVKHWEFIPRDKSATTLKGTVIYEKEQYPEDVNEAGIELHTAPATRYHMLDLLQAIEYDHAPVADVEEGHISTAACILANISMNLGRPLRYDPDEKIVIDDAEATELLRRPYRVGYDHPWRT